MLLVVYVLLAAAGVVLWTVLSSWFPRAGLAANAAAFVYAMQSVLVGEFAMGLGWTLLWFITVGFGLFAAIGGHIEQRQRARGSNLPRASIRE